MTLTELMFAIMLVESGGDATAIGDNGTAHGCLQLTENYIQDASTHAEENWTVQDAYDKETSAKIFVAYMDKYATEERIGRKVTPEDIARIHNGGPNGWSKKSTESYWKKVNSYTNHGQN
jgi:hypothetical protein